MTAHVLPLSLNVEYPEKLAPLFDPARYKVLYGGRGGAKSWGIARALLEIGIGRSIRVGCFREIQKSIKESVHALLKAQIEAMGLGWAYEVQEARIFSKIPGITTEFVFSGLRSLNVENIKSFEGLDIAWVEEARNVTKRSWDILVPTIRKPGSEIWVSFNPELDSDETYKRFVTNADERMVLIDMSWRDNPWFADTELEGDRRVMEKLDPDGYLTVWEGKCRQYLEGAIYAREIRAATAEGRIARVPYEPMRPVHTFWDLGYSDSTAIWLVQSIGFEFHVIGYIEGSGQKLEYYTKELAKLDYQWGIDWLPHDGRAKTLQTGMSTEQLLRQSGRNVRIVPSITVADGINAARTVFGRCWFDSNNCADGLNRLRRYAYELDDQGHRSKLPLHDENSHGADGFRMFAVANRSVTPKSTTTLKIQPVAVN